VSRRSRACPRFYSNASSTSRDFAATLEDDGVDSDTVQHQLKAALRYYEACTTISVQVYAETAAEHSDRHEWGKPVRPSHTAVTVPLLTLRTQGLPLGATLAHAPPKSDVPRLKAGYAKPMRAHPALVQRAMRTSKFEGGQLVGPATTVAATALSSSSY
jgi:hypothetical protein